MSTISRRLGALVAAGALTASGLALIATPAQAATHPRAVDQGASWLSGQLTNGLIHNPNFGGFDDYGLSIDAELALAAIGDHVSDVKAIANKIRDNYYNYTRPSLDFGSDTSYGGGIAKALVAAQVAQTQPASYQQNVQADLEDHIGSAAPIEGRVQNLDETDFNTGQPTDTANVFGQAYAARALTEATSTKAAAVTHFLLIQQCSAGFFRQDFSAKLGPQDCNDGAASTYGDQIGATTTAVLNLMGSPTLMSDSDVTDAIDAAVAWLKDQQAADGSFNSGNSNSTGLAGWVLGANGETAAATKAADFLRNLQANDTDACTKLAGSVGAVAFDTAALADGRANGIPTTDVSNGKQDQWRRTTVQVLPALQYLSPAPTATPALTGPAGYAQAGTTAAYKVTGAVGSSKLCATTAGSAATGTATAAGVASIGLKLPAGTANRTVKVVDRDGNSATVVTKVLGARTLVVKPAAKRVKKGRTVAVTVSGLAAGETVTLRYRGAIVATGKATSAGTFVRKVAVGKKVGKATIAAFGQFSAIRKGATTITVVR